MAFAGENTPLRVGEDGDRRLCDASSSGMHHALHRVSYQDANAAALRSGSSQRELDQPDIDRRRALRGVMRSMGAAATMAATGLALIVVVWTQRTHTLQDSWRPVPGAGLDATFGAGDTMTGTFASRFMGVIATHGSAGGLVDTEPSLGAGVVRDARDSLFPEGVKPQYYVFQEIAEPAPRTVAAPPLGNRDEVLAQAKAAMDAVAVRTVVTSVVSAERQQGIDTAKAAKVAGSWGRAFGLRQQPTLALAKLGAEASSARRAGFEVAIDSETSQLGVMDSLVGELVADENDTEEFDPNDPNDLISELTTPTETKPAIEFDLPVDPTVVAAPVEVGGSVVPREETFELPIDETVEVGGSVEVPVEEEEEDVESVELGGSIKPPEVKSNDDEESALDAEAAAELADMESSTEEPDTAKEPESTAVSEDDDLFESASAEQTLPAPEEDPVAKEPEDPVPVDAVEESPGVVKRDTADADDKFASSIAEVLHANRGERESRAAARAIAKELKRSLDRDDSRRAKTESAETSKTPTKQAVDPYASPQIGTLEERLAERVAELLRPRVAGGFAGAGGNAPLVSINVNTNTGVSSGESGVSTSAAQPSVTQPVLPTTDATTSTALYERLIQALSAKSGGGTADPSLQQAARHFVDELAKQVGDDQPWWDAKETNTKPDATVEAAKSVGVDEILDRTTQAAAKAETNVSAAGVGEGEDEERVGESRKLPPQKEEKATAKKSSMEKVSTHSKTSKHEDSDFSSFWDDIDALVPDTPTEADVEALKRKAEKARRAEQKLTGKATLVIPDAQQEFLAGQEEMDLRKGKKDDARSRTGKSLRESESFDVDPLDEDPDGPSMAGIDGVIHTAEAMSQVWAADPKMKVGDKGDAPVSVARDTRVTGAHVKLNKGLPEEGVKSPTKNVPMAKKESKKEKSTLGEMQEMGRSAITSLLHELGI